MKPNARIIIKPRIRTLIATEEEKTGKRVSGRGIARDAGLSPSAVTNLSLGRTRRLDLHVIEALIAYFEDSWGETYTLDDLFTIERN